MDSFKDVSVSTHTLNTVDLLCNYFAFLDCEVPDFLDDIMPGNVVIDILSSQDRDNLMVLAELSEHGKFEGMLDEALHSLEDTLGDMAPKGYYFGPHPGNSSDIGYWSDYA